MSYPTIVDIIKVFIL